MDLFFSSGSDPHLATYGTKTPPGFFLRPGGSHLPRGVGVPPGGGGPGFLEKNVTKIPQKTSKTATISPKGPRGFSLRAGGSGGTPQSAPEERRKYPKGVCTILVSKTPQGTGLGFGLAGPPEGLAGTPPRGAGEGGSQTGLGNGQSL